MRREWSVHLRDIIESITKIRDYTRGMDKSSFVDDIKTQDAVIRNLAVIGEATRVLPEEIKERAPSIEWRKITALRNILIHEYFGVSIDIVWDVVENKLDELHDACERLLQNT